MKKNISNDSEIIIQDNSFPLNNYFFNIRDSVFSMIINILSSDEKNPTNININNINNINNIQNEKIKTPNESKKYYNKRLSNKIKDQVNKNHTYNRNDNNKLYKFFIKKEKRESINTIKKDRLYNINTINHSELNKKKYSRNNYINVNQNNITNKEKKNYISNKNLNNINNNLFRNDKINCNVEETSNNKKMSNLKMSQKIHFYVQNILDNIPHNQNIKINDTIIIKKENINNINADNNNKANHFFLYKNKKNHSQNILNEDNKILHNKELNKNRTTFNNYITTYQKRKEKNNNIEKINIIQSQNSYNYFNQDKISENLSKSTSLNKINNKNTIFQNILFNISNIKFKHLLIIFLDQKSICSLSSTNKIFHKNLRIFFFNNLSKRLLSDNKDIYINKIIRSIFKYSFKVKNKSEFKKFYESLKYPNKLYTDIINKDLLRTFPEDKNFNKGNKYYKKLLNLLTCYSNYNKNIGYAQGLNFIFANAIYLFSSEEDIFLFVDGLINFLKLENFLGIYNQNNLPEKINYISNILEKYIPDIIKVFNEKFVKIEIFLTNWILTIFSCSMNRKNLIICWCFMILFGWKFFYCFIIQILIHYQDIIFSLNEVDLCKKMKNILFTIEFNQDFKNIINRTIDFMKDHIIL